MRACVCVRVYIPTRWSTLESGDNIQPTCPPPSIYGVGRQALSAQELNPSEYAPYLSSYDRCTPAQPHDRTNRPTPCDLLTCHFQSLANLIPKVAPFSSPGLFHALAGRPEISRRYPIKPIPNFIAALTRDPHPIILCLHTTPGPLEFHPINRRSNCYSSFP